MICLDIPMPESCGDCRLMVDGWCYALQGDSHLNRYAADMDKRPDWCPIKEIIQCKHCKHYQFAGNLAFGLPVRACEFWGFEDMDEDEFCSRGEREERDGNE